MVDWLMRLERESDALYADRIESCMDKDIRSIDSAIGLYVGV